MPSEILVEKNVKVPMRDGVELATDVYRPPTSM
jgi:predicted acyl esterase